METRRIRRRKQRHLHRILAVMASIGALGLGVGLALPRSTTASVLLLAMALLGLASIGARAEFVAPSHGLTRVVRLPTTTAISAAFDSFRSKIVGTVHTIQHRAALQSAGSALDREQGADELVRRVDVRHHALAGGSGYYGAALTPGRAMTDESTESRNSSSIGDSTMTAR
jgi:hypothetical protein